MKIKTNFLFVVMACAVGLMSSCELDNSIDVIMDFGGGGDFTVINMGTNDTLKISGRLPINIGGGSPILVAHNGNVIKIKFEQEETYKDYFFNTIYTLPNDKVIEDEPEYEYVVGNDLNGKYDIYLIAKSSGETSNKSWDISAFGSFVLNVIE